MRSLIHYWETVLKNQGWLNFTVYASLSWPRVGNLRIWAKQHTFLIKFKQIMISAINWFLRSLKSNCTVVESSVRPGWLFKSCKPYLHLIVIDFQTEIRLLVLPLLLSLFPNWERIIDCLDWSLGTCMHSTWPNIPRFQSIKIPGSTR